MTPDDFPRDQRSSRAWRLLRKSAVALWCVIAVFLGVFFPRTDRYRGEFDFAMLKFVDPLIVPGWLFDTALGEWLELPGNIGHPVRTIGAVLFSSTFWALLYFAAAAALVAVYLRVTKR